MPPAIPVNPHRTAAIAQVMESLEISPSVLNYISCLSGE